MRSLARHGAYEVRCELSVRNGRIDIAAQSPRFLLYIELKRSGGVETWAQGRAQLRRHLYDLRARARDPNVAAWGLLLLGPKGKLPSVAECAVLSHEEFAAALADIEGPTLNARGFAAFLGAYSRC